MKNTSESTIIICSIVRNAEKGLRRNIPVIKQLCSCFSDYMVFVYENDSDDKTKKLLSEWAASDSDHVLVSLNDNDHTNTIPTQNETGKVNPFYSARRINKMAKLRNHYMDYVEQHNWGADYMMVIDLDVAGLSLDGILNSFESREDWHAITAYGYSLGPNLRKRYHDTYALTEYGDEYTPQTTKKIHFLAKKYGKLVGSQDLIRVFSAFGGLAIYKFEAVRGLKYQAIPNEDEKVEVRCEHYSIYKQMVERGYDKIYINPQMALKYQALTLKIILNSIRRKLRI